MIFSRNYRNRQEKLSLKVNGKLINTVTKAIFLGINIDQQLNWNDRINAVVNSCKSKINLLRSLTGQLWGAGKYSLLKIYRTLIRPRLDYGLELFYTASKGSWKKLETIQTTCLRLACGAMRGTANDTLQQECGELPLKLRRKRAILRYTAKLSITSNNPASNILEDSWHLHYAKYKSGTEPIRIQVNSFMAENRIQPKPLQYKPPWTSAAINIDTSIQTKIIGEENETVKLQIVNKHLLLYGNTIKIFTDASVQKNGHTGAAYYIPSKNEQATFRLANNISIVSAELFAIKLALDTLNTNLSRGDTVSLISDSLTAVKLLQDSKPNYTGIESEINYRASLLLAEKQLQINLIWIPAHIGIYGNEKADILAKEGAKKTQLKLLLKIH